MTNIFINNLQLNTGNIRCNITSTETDKSFITNNEDIYGLHSPYVSETSSGIENYTFNITLFSIPNEDSYNELTIKLRRIYDQIKLSQSINRFPLLLKTNDTKIYFNYNEVIVLVDSFNFNILGEAAGKYIDIIIECSIFGVPDYLDGGTIDMSTPYSITPRNSIGADAIAEFSVAE